LDYAKTSVAFGERNEVVLENLPEASNKVQSEGDEKFVPVTRPKRRKVTNDV
jgi:hypothetical protein